MPSSKDLPKPRDRIYISYVSCIVRRVLHYQCHLESSTSKGMFNIMVGLGGGEGLFFRHRGDKRRCGHGAQ